jgi:hypothetical protein
MPPAVRAARAPGRATCAIPLIAGASVCGVAATDETVVMVAAGVFAVVTVAVAAAAAVQTPAMTAMAISPDLVLTRT